MSKQDSPINFFKGLKEGMSNDINCSMLGRIDTFDGVKMKATVVPMVKSKGKEKPILIEVPVSFINAGGFIIKPSYQRGDIVVIVFADEDIDNVLLSGKVSNANSTRTHSLDDALIVGSIMPFNQSMPSQYKDDLVIGKRDMSSKIIFKKNGAIEISSSKGITITGPNNSSNW